MKKQTFDKKNYNFIDLSETDINQFSQLEIDKMVEETKEVLQMTKGQVKKSIMNLGLAGGLLHAKGGQFVKINAFTGAKWKKGNTTKEEQKMLNKVFTTARFYYLFKVVIVLISKNESQQDTINPTLVQKIEA